MKQTLIFCLFFHQVMNSDVLLTDITSENASEGNTISKGDVGSTKIKMANCWMSLNTPKFFKALDSIDDQYAKIRKSVQEDLLKNKLDEVLMNALIVNRGLALRELYKHNFVPQMIPSGIQLGGYSMIKMRDSVLFFHRMKLRNNTYFRLNSLKNDLMNMVLKLDLSLNDLHLKGAYERALIDNDPSVFIYAPTFGEAEFLLKDVKFNVEGRYRLLNKRLRIEMIKSEMKTNNVVLMTYVNQAIQDQAIRIEMQHLGDFMGRLRMDLNRWLKDYFNDFLAFANTTEIGQSADLEKYDREKTTALAEHTDDIIESIKARILSLNAASLKLPSFTFKAVNGLQIKLYDGLVQGLDSIHRRDIATGAKEKNVRIFDTIVGFSNLKVIYKYESVIPTGLPPLTGMMTLSANELSAHLSVGMADRPEAIDLNIEFLEQMKPESLNVEGAANLMISNFKHLLEHQIVSVMSSFLVFGIRKLQYLPRCNPFDKSLIPAPVKLEKDMLMFSREEQLRTSNKSDEDIQVLKKTESQFQSSTKLVRSRFFVRSANRKNLPKSDEDIQVFKKTKSHFQPSTKLVKRRQFA